MIDLDDKEKIIAFQKGRDVVDSIGMLPQQIKAGFKGMMNLEFPSTYLDVRNILIAGMGGSRFPAYITYSLLKDKLKIPYLITSDYIFPEFVDENTLFVASSYSGTTEEVVISLQKARDAKARLTGITTGGKVAKILKKENKPVFVFNPIFNPSGQPRIGFGYAVGAHLALPIKLGLVRNPKTMQKQIKNAINRLPALLKKFSIENEKNNPAKELARKIYKRYPYFVVSEFLIGEGNAIANQTNETAKSISEFRIIPELNHHLMEGLKFPKEFRKLAIFVFFHSKQYSPRIQKRFKITEEVVKKNKIETVWIELSGKTPEGALFEMMGLGSYFSLYLSLLYEQDPRAIPYVDYFKKKLKE